MKKFRKILATRQLVSVVAIGLALNVEGMSAPVVPSVTGAPGVTQAIVSDNLDPTIQGTLQSPTDGSTWIDANPSPNGGIDITATGPTPGIANVKAGLGTIVLDIENSNAVLLPGVFLNIDISKTFGLIDGTNSNVMPGTITLNGTLRTANNLPLALLLLGQQGTWSITANNPTANALPAITDIAIGASLSKGGLDFIPTSITGGGDITITDGVTATTSLPTGTTTINTGASLFHTPAINGQSINLAGRGLFTLVSGSVTATGSSPDLFIGGNMTVTGAYGLGDPVEVTILRNGIINVPTGASLNAKSLTYTLGDDNFVDGNTDQIKTGRIDLSGGGSLSLTPPTINVIPDPSLSPTDITQKLWTTQPGTLVSTLMTATGGSTIPAGLALDPSIANFNNGIFRLGIRNVGNNLELYVVETTQSNLTIDSNTLQDFGTGQFSTGAESTSNTIASFRAKAAQLVKGAKNLLNAFSKKPIEIQKQESAEPLVMESFDKQSALFFSTYYGDSKTNHSQFTAASLDHQTGVLVGMMKRLPDQYIAAYLGISAAHARARFGDRLTQFTKGMELGGFYSREFLKDAEWNNSVTILLGWGEKRRTAAGGGNVFISKPKTQKGLLGTELGYKFKLDKGVDGKTYFSIKPYGGLKLERTETLTHSEKSATGPGLTFKENHFGILNSYIGLGVRKRINIDDFSLKITALLDFYQNIKRPNRMTSDVFLSNSSTPLTLESNPYAKNKLIGSLVGSVKHKESLWKGFMTGSAFRSGKKSGKQISIMLNRAF